jgi:hypothetical protein
MFISFLFQLLPQWLFDAIPNDEVHGYAYEEAVNVIILIADDDKVFEPSTFLFNSTE